MKVIEMISCEQFDYIELVCMFQYPVQLVLNDGSVVEGVAKDTARNDAGEECIVLEVDSIQQLLVLHRVEKLKVLVKNPHFDEVEFSPASGSPAD